jgi:cell division protein FtsL
MLESPRPAEPKDRDRAPGRESIKGWLSCALVLGIIFVACASSYVWLRIQQVQNGYRLSKLQDAHGQLLTVQRKLHLEWNRLQDPSYMERLAKERFGLTPPKKDQRILMR